MIVRLLFLFFLSIGFALTVMLVAVLFPEVDQDNLQLLLGFDFLIIFLVNFLASLTEKTETSALNLYALKASSLTILAVLPAILYQACKAQTPGGFDDETIFASIVRVFLAGDGKAWLCIVAGVLSLFAFGLLLRMRILIQQAEVANTRLWYVVDVFVWPIAAVVTLITYNMINQSIPAHSRGMEQEAVFYALGVTCLSVFLSTVFISGLCYTLLRSYPWTALDILLILSIVGLACLLIVGLPGSQFALLDFILQWQSFFQKIGVADFFNSVRVFITYLMVFLGVVALAGGVLALIFFIIHALLSQFFKGRTATVGGFKTLLCLILLLPAGWITGMTLATLGWDEARNRGSSIYYRVQLGAYSSGGLRVSGTKRVYEVRGCYIYESEAYQSELWLSINWFRLSFVQLFNLIKGQMMDRPFVNYYRNADSTYRFRMVPTNRFRWPKNSIEARSIREDCP